MKERPSSIPDVNGGKDTVSEQIRRRIDLAAGLALFAITFTVFLLSPVRQILDSRYSMLVSEHLLRHGDFEMKGEFILPLDPSIYPVISDNGYPATMQRFGDHVYYGYPWGSSVLSVPFITVFHLFGISSMSPDGTYLQQGEDKTQMLIASLLMAGLSVTFFFTSRLMLPLWASLLTGLAGAFGTQIWSTASRALWSHTWQIFLLGLLVYLLARTEIRQDRLRHVVMATLLSWAYFVRPTGSIPVIAVSVYVLLFHRNSLLKFVLTGAAWLAAFLALSWHDYHQWLPPYYRLGGLLSVKNPFVQNFYAILMSPSRGLFTCVPLALIIGYLLIRNFSALHKNRLVLLSVSVILLQIIILAFYPCGWVGGGSFGSRYLTDTVPWLMMLAIYGFSARQREPRGETVSGVRWVTMLEIPVCLLLLAASVFINGRGATSYQVWAWNGGMPADSEIDLQRQWVMDWRYPQWLAGWISPPLPHEFPLLTSGQKLEIGLPRNGRYLRSEYGWSSPEIQFRRSDSRTAQVIFRMAPPSSPMLELKVNPLLSPPRLRAQRLILKVNDQPIATLLLTDPAPRIYQIRIPDETLGENNILQFEMPDARTAASLGVAEDQRFFGAAFHWLRVISEPPHAGTHCVVCYTDQLPSGLKLTSAGFACKLALLSALPPRNVAAKPQIIKVRVTNQSEEVWSRFEPEKSSRFAVNIGYHWVDAHGKGLKEGQRAFLPEPLLPGQSVDIEMMIESMPDSGTYLLKVEPVQEGNAWFSEAGGCSATIPVTFAP